jgi:hypothetical protein
VKHGACTPTAPQVFYSYTKLSSAKGVLNTNCSIELDGKNYCFGIDDIWVHDGISEKSLCDEKTRDFIFGSLNISQADKCFVQFNPRLNEIYFGYVSGDPADEVQDVNGCNRTAVYNLTTETGPSTTPRRSSRSTTAPCPTCSPMLPPRPPTTDVGGSYQDQEDGGKRVTVCVGDAAPHTASRPRCTPSTCTALAPSPRTRWTPTPPLRST